MRSSQLTAIRNCLSLPLAAALVSTPALAEGPPPSTSPASLEQQFQNPPDSARPRVWWHWMNGNVTRDGIAKDLAWLRSIGVGGVQHFDANLTTPQVVPHRLTYMTPEWKDALRFAVSEADRLGLEFAIASSPGWSLTGGPWVPPEDGMKKLVWSQSLVEGGKPTTIRLPAPPFVTGPFQSIATSSDVATLLNPGETHRPSPIYYADVAVLAYPEPASRRQSLPRAVSREGLKLDVSRMMDGDPASTISVPKGASASPPSITFDYGQKQTMRSVTLYLPGATSILAGVALQPVLEASDDGKSWQTIAEVPTGSIPRTTAFAPVVARYFRMLFRPRSSQGAPSAFGDMAPGIDMSPLMAMFAGGDGGDELHIGELNLSPEPRIDRYEAKAGFEIEQNYYALSQGVPEAIGVPPRQVIDLTRKLRADGTLDWAPPKGNWRVIRLGMSLLGTENHPAPAEATGLEVDKLDRAAVRRYLERYLGQYRDAAGPEMVGKQGIGALLTDSIQVGAFNWTPELIAQFRRLRGYDPTPWLPALTGTLIGSRSESDRFLYDYRRTLADLIASEHYGTLAEFAHQNGLKVYGEALEDHRASVGDDMALRRYSDVPMAAMWTYADGGQPRATHLADMKGAASVAHVYGQNLVAAESLTSALSYWRHSPASLKRFIDLAFVTGVNLPVIHTSVHQPVDDKVPGLSLLFFGQYFNRHETWAEMAKPWIDYIARNSLMLQQGRNVADVAYFYGEEGPLTGLYGDTPVADAPRTSAYDFVNADALVGALRNDGDELVSSGGARYKVLYLGGSSGKMTLPTLRRLAELVEGGATIVGMKPEGSPGLVVDKAEYDALTANLWSGAETTPFGKGRVIASSDIETSLRGIGIAPDFAYTGGQPDTDILFVHRRLSDGDSYFLVNRKPRTETVEARFRVTGKIPELWRAETGTSTPLSYRISGGETIVALNLAAEESVHVVFRKPSTTNAFTVADLQPVELARLNGPWKVSFQSGRGAPASIVLPDLAALDQYADPSVKYFSGIATYEKEFAAPQAWRRGQALSIDLGDVRELAEVRINGVPAGTVWHTPFRLDIGTMVKPGRNRLEIRVANLWVNRLIGDAQPGATKSTWTQSPTYLANAPLQPSGLIGPVTLVGDGAR